MFGRSDTGARVLRVLLCVGLILGYGLAVGMTAIKAIERPVSAKGLSEPAMMEKGTRNAVEVAASELHKLMSKADHIIVMRHALAPGVGDPPQFRLGDCSTQRNLSPAGREQAVRIGKRLKAAGLTVAEVYSSQWCRCLETAELLNLGPVTELPLLNSFFRSRGQEGEQTWALREWIKTAELTRPVVLVTHQVNVTALTGVFPAQGEFLILHRKERELRVVARYGEH